MKANTTPKRVYNLFQHPSKRFTDAVDQRIINYHTVHGNGLTEEEIIAIAQAQIANADLIPEGVVTYGGEIGGWDEDINLFSWANLGLRNLLTEANIGKVFQVIEGFTIIGQEFIDGYDAEAPSAAYEDYVQSDIENMQVFHNLFYNNYNRDATFAAGTCVIVVKAARPDFEDEEPVICFDVLNERYKPATKVTVLYDEDDDSVIKVPLSNPEEGLSLGNILSYRVVANFTETQSGDDREYDITNYCSLDLDAIASLESIVYKLPPASQTDWGEMLIGNPGSLTFNNVVSFIAFCINL